MTVLYSDTIAHKGLPFENGRSCSSELARPPLVGCRTQQLPALPGTRAGPLHATLEGLLRAHCVQALQRTAFPATPLTRY